VGVRRTQTDSPVKPGGRPLRKLPGQEIAERFEAALIERNGEAGAHCIHELWMREESAMIIERMLDMLWQAAPESVPEWMPMRHVEWLRVAYEEAAQFERVGRGRTNIYLVLLDYRDSPRGPYGVYVGLTKYPPAVRFDQHKAGIRAAGSVLKRGLEVLTGPVLHLQGLKRAQAAAIEEQLAEALRAQGLLVKGGH
jgi:hypothetical protein